MNLLAACLILAIEHAENEVQLAGWWGRHQDAMRALSPDDLAQVVEAKDRKVAAWNRALDARLAQERGKGQRERFW